MSDLTGQRIRRELTGASLEEIQAFVQRYMIRTGEWIPMPPAPRDLSAENRFLWDAARYTGTIVLMSNFYIRDYGEWEWFGSPPLPFRLTGVEMSSFAGDMDGWWDGYWNLDEVIPLPAAELAGYDFGNLRSSDPVTYDFYSPSYNEDGRHECLDTVWVRSDLAEREGRG